MATNNGPSVVTAAPGLFLFKSVLWQMNSPVLARGGEALVVDPGYFPLEVAAVREFVDREGLAPRVLFTHGDFDHVVGWPEFPSAPRWGSAAMLTRDRARVERQIHEYDAQFYIERDHPFTFPSLDVRLPAGGAAGLAAAGANAPARLRLADLELLFYSAPGHTADGVITVVPDLRLAICGDYLSDLEFPFVEDSLAGYRATLALLAQLTAEFGIETLVPGHGPLAFSRAAILQRVAQDQAYLAALAAAAASPSGDPATLSYRGKDIPPHLLESHLANFRLARRSAKLADLGV